MSLEGLNIIVGEFAKTLFGLHSPGNCHSTLMLGISHGSSNSKALVQSRVDAVPLFVRVKIKGREPCRHEIKGVDIGLDSHIDDGIHSTIPIRSRTSRSDILEGKALIKGTREFILCPLLCKKLL